MVRTLREHVVVFDGDDQRLRPRVRHTKFVYQEDGEYYTAECLGDIEATEATIILQGLKGTQIPESHCHGLWHDGITLAPHSLPQDVYVKTPRMNTYDGTSKIAETINAELEIHETLARHPHPNISEYYGCLKEGPYIRGICLSSYQCRLSDLIWDCIPDIKYVLSSSI